MWPHGSWMKVLALSLSLPSIAVGISYMCYALFKKGVLSRPLAALLFVFVVGHIIGMMIYYASKKKT